MKKFSSLGVGKLLDSLIEDDIRFEAAEKKLIRMLILGGVAFVLWAIYFIHVIQNYRLTPIILR